MPTLFAINANHAMNRKFNVENIHLDESDDQSTLPSYIELAFYIMERIIEKIYEMQPAQEMSDLLDKIGVILGCNNTHVLVPFTTDINEIQTQLQSIEPVDIDYGDINIADLIIHGSKYANSIFGTLSSISIVAIVDSMNDAQIEFLCRSIELYDDNYSTEEKLIPSNIHITVIELEPKHNINSTIHKVYNFLNRLVVIRHQVRSGYISENLPINCLDYNNNNVEESLNNDLLEKIYLDIDNTLSNSGINFYDEDKIIISCGNLHSTICYLYPKLFHHKTGWNEYENSGIFQANIIGFIDILDFEMPPTSRKFLILNIDGKHCCEPFLTELDRIKTTYIKNDDNESPTSNVVNNEATTFDNGIDQQPEFEILLFGSLKIEDMYAIVQLKDNQYGFIRPHNFCSKKKSTLMLCVFGENSYIPNIGKFEHLATSIAFEEYPYVCDDEDGGSEGESEESPFPISIPPSLLPSYSYNKECERLFLFNYHNNESDADEDDDYQNDESFSFITKYTPFDTSIKDDIIYYESDILHDGYDIEDNSPTTI